MVSDGEDLIKCGFKENISKNHLKFISKLKDLFPQHRSDPNFREVFKLSLLGIIDTARASLFTKNDIKKEEFNICDFKEDTWNCTLSEASKSYILNWIKAFTVIYNCRPEALITGNLWSVVLRFIALGIEDACTKHSDESGGKIQCFCGLKLETIKAFGGKKYFTDLVYLAGCSGLPLLTVEIAPNYDIYTKTPADIHFPLLHQDTKKLAVEMGTVLLQLVTEIRGSQDAIAKEFLPKLRVFGALISGTQIRFCTSRLQFDSQGKFVILFEEDRDATFDLFKSNEKPARSADTSSSDLSSHISREDIKGKDIDYDYDYESSSSSTTSTSSSTSILIELLCSREEDEVSTEIPSDSDSERKRKSSGDEFGEADLDSIASISKFMGQVHSYYKSLPDSILQIYLHPLNDVTDPNLLLIAPKPPKILENQQEASCQVLFGGTPHYLVPINAPTQFIFITLPPIRSIVPASGPDSDNWKWEAYREGVSFSEVYESVEKRTHQENHLTRKRILMRAQLILGILMAICKAHQAGFVFKEFDCKDMCHRDDIFCIKTYRNVVPVSSPNAPDLKTTLKAFCELYYDLFLLDTYMTAGDAEYSGLRNLERVALKRAWKLGSDEDVWWKGLFEDALQAHKSILEQFDMKQDNCIYFLKSILS